MQTRSRTVEMPNGRPHYGGRGFTREPGSRDAHFELIERILNDPEETKITEREIELAWCYGDIYWNQIPQPYPSFLFLKFLFLHHL